MSAVRFLIPKVRLGQAVRTPGGLSVAEAVERAETNLASIRPACHAQLTGLLEAAEAAFERLPGGFDDAGMAEVYAIAVSGIGAGQVSGVPAVDEALGSLCDLVDNLRTTSRFDRDALGVHIRSWRLLMNAALPADGQTDILSGLRKISGRYAA